MSGREAMIINLPSVCIHIHWYQSLAHQQQKTGQHQARKTKVAWLSFWICFGGRLVAEFLCGEWLIWYLSTKQAKTEENQSNSPPPNEVECGCQVWADITPEWLSAVNPHVLTAAAALHGKGWKRKMLKTAQVKSPRVFNSKDLLMCKD